MGEVTALEVLKEARTYLGYGWNPGGWLSVDPWQIIGGTEESRRRRQEALDVHATVMARMDSNELGFRLDSGTVQSLVVAATPDEMRKMTEGSVVKPCLVQAMFMGRIVFNGDIREKITAKATKWDNDAARYVEWDEGPRTTSTDQMSFYLTRRDKPFIQAVRALASVMFEQGVWYVEDEFGPEGEEPDVMTWVNFLVSWNDSEAIGLTTLRDDGSDGLEVSGQDGVCVLLDRAIVKLTEDPTYARHGVVAARR